MRVGDPDGHGHYAQLDRDTDGLLICHECGRPCAQLATHARLAHGITAAQYREAHGLGMRTRLVSASASARMAAAFERNRQLHLDALAGSRNPPAATEASRHAPWRAESRAKRQRVAAARRGRPLTSEETEWLGDDIDLQAWSDRARVLLAQPDISARSIAEAVGLATPSVLQRLRRHPPR
jgi:ROS/MUCR transcriptional regulator protein.